MHFFHLLDRYPIKINLGILEVYCNFSFFSCIIQCTLLKFSPTNTYFSVNLGNIMISISKHTIICPFLCEIVKLLLLTHCKWPHSPPPMPAPTKPLPPPLWLSLHCCLCLWVMYVCSLANIPFYATHNYRIFQNFIVLFNHLSMGLCP